MIIQPYRIVPNDKEDSLAELYEFLVIGSKPYRVLLEIDEFNGTGLINYTCTCPHSIFRHADCKHIKKAMKVLDKFKKEVKRLERKSGFANKTNLGGNT